MAAKASAVCIRECFTPIGYFRPGDKVDIDPDESYAPHFKFNNQKIQQTVTDNALLHRMEVLEKEVAVLKDFVEQKTATRVQVMQLKTAETRLAALKEQIA